MKVTVSVNRHKIIKNNKDGKKRRVFRVARGRKITYCNYVDIPDGAKARVMYSPDKPLACGAKAWIEWEE